MKKIREVRPPRGIEKSLFKLPNFLYDVGLGSLMGGRFLQLSHVGRKSGKMRKTVIEVIHFDADLRKIYAPSGYLQKSDWYKNIIHNAQVKVNFRGKQYPAQAVELNDSDAGKVLLTYTHKHPLAMRELAKFMGYEMDGSHQDVRLLAAELPIIEMRLLG